MKWNLLKMNDKKIDLTEGTITFWIPKRLFCYNDNKTHILFNLSNNQGSILIIKDDDNKLKLFHVLLGEGRTDIELDVKNISNKERHMIAATWSISKKEINLYLDGDKKKNKKLISY